MRKHKMLLAVRFLAYAAIAVVVSEPEVKALYAILALTELEELFS